MMCKFSDCTGAQGPAKKVARQLAAASLLERLVETMGVHEFLGKQHRPEPKDPQASRVLTPSLPLQLP